jgi:hypothetical protein
MTAVGTSTNNTNNNEISTFQIFTNQQKSIIGNKFHSAFSSSVVGLANFDVKDE